MPVRFKQDSNYVPGLNRARFPITGTGAIRNVGSSLPGARMPILADNYLVYYFNESSGTGVTNYGALAGNNLTISGTGATRNDVTIYPKGTPGTAIARTSPITYAANTALTGMPTYGTGQGYTVEMTCSWSATHSGSNEGIFQLSLGTSTYPGNSLYLYRNSLTQITLVGVGYFGGSTVVATVPSSTNLCHIAGIFKNGSFNYEYVDLYVNGQFIGSSQLPVYSYARTFNAFYIGSHDGSTCPSGFKVGEVRVSAGTIRSAAYIQQAYNNALTL